MIEQGISRWYEIFIDQGKTLGTMTIAKSPDLEKLGKIFNGLSQASHHRMRIDAWSCRSENSVPRNRRLNKKEQAIITKILGFNPNKEKK